MEILNDYKSWLSDNKDFINLLKKNKSAIYQRIADVFRILEHIDKVYIQEKKVDAVLEEIFEIAYSYLFDTLQEVKLYYEKYFNRDYILFRQYESLINYILYLEDVKNSLIDNKQLTDENRQILDEILEECDQYLNSKKPYKIEVLEQYNDKLDAYFGDSKVLTMLEVFDRIYEELMIEK